MDESQYLHLVDEAFKSIEDAFADVDPDIAEAFTAGDVLTVTFADRTRCVVNTQRPTRQIWLAAQSRAWHFDYDATTGRWCDDRGHGDELFATLRAVTKSSAGVELSIKA